MSLAQPLSSINVAFDTGEWAVCPLDDVAKLDDPTRSVPSVGETDCPDCHVEMTKSWNEHNLVCSRCSRVFPIGNTGEHTIGAGENHNTSSNAYMCFKPVGTNNKLYHNTMIKYTSEYEPYRDAKILDLLKQYNYIHKDFTISQDVIKAACEMFIRLKEHDYVRRGRTRRGVLGACILVECQKHGVTKTKTQIAEMMQVEEAKITFGLEELQQYANLGVIEMPENVDPTADYISAYFEIFDIDQKYKTFVLDLLERMTKKRVDEVSQCFNTTKCIGVVYFLGKLVRLNITHEMIAANCNNISRNTYLAVANAVVKNEEKLRKVFIRHDMPLPPGWKLKRS